MSAKPTGQQIVKKVEELKARIDVLPSVVASIRGVENAEQALSFHSLAMGIKDLEDTITVDAKNVQKPVPVENGQRVVELGQEISSTVIKILNELVAKKPVLDKLGVANLTTMIARDIKELHDSGLKMINAMIDNGPDDPEVKRQAREIRDGIDKAFKAASPAFA